MLLSYDFVKQILIPDAIFSSTQSLCGFNELQTEFRACPVDKTETPINVYGMSFKTMPVSVATHIFDGSAADITALEAVAR